MSEVIEEFTAAARAFCDFVTDPPDEDEMGVARLLRGLLADLYAAGLKLPETLDLDYSDEEWDADISHEEWKEVFHRIGKRLPASYYHTTVGDAWEIDTDPEWCLGDLGDDIADIWGDLEEGFRMLKAGAPEDDAVWHWRLCLNCHWGVHAVEALTILQKIVV